MKESLGWVVGMFVAMTALADEKEKPSVVGKPPAATLIAKVAKYTEGVVVDRAGQLYFSSEDTVYRVRDGEATPWAKTGGPNGHKILGDGTHLVCDNKKHAVLRLDAEGKALGAASDQCDGKPLREPNDLSLDPAGGFYFTDPASSNETKPDGTVHHVDPAGKTVLVAEGLAYPNGIVLRPDRKTLLVGESKRNRVLVFEVLSPGKVGPKKVFVDLPTKSGGQVDNQPDGMCLDAAGNLYVAHYGMREVQVVSPDGVLIARYPAGNLLTSNVAFAGPRLDQLFVTGAINADGSAGALFRLDLGVEGLRILPPSR